MISVVRHRWSDGNRLGRVAAWTRRNLTPPHLVTRPLLLILLALIFAGSAQAAQLGGYASTDGQRGPAYTRHGVVETNPRVVLIFWGWTGTQFEQQLLSAEQTMFGEMAWSEWGQILTQYGVHDDTRLEATVTDTSTPPARTLTHQDFVAEVLHAQRLAHLKGTFDTQWIVFPSASANPYMTKHFSSECGEHDGFFLHHQRYNYLVIPSSTAEPYSTWCTDPKQSLVESTTATTSHEFAEDATNPLQFHNKGWWIKVTGQPDNIQEVADICDWQNGVPPGMTVMMQAIWSNASEGPNKDRGCVLSARGGVPQLRG